MPVPSENQQTSSFLSSQISLVNTCVELVQIAPAQAWYLNNLKNLALDIRVFQTFRSALGIY